MNEVETFQISERDPEPENGLHLSPESLKTCPENLLRKKKKRENYTTLKYAEHPFKKARSNERRER